MNLFSDKWKLFGARVNEDAEFVYRMSQMSLPKGAQMA